MLGHLVHITQAPCEERRAARLSLEMNLEQLGKGEAFSPPFPLEHIMTNPSHHPDRDPRSPSLSMRDGSRHPYDIIGSINSKTG